MRKYLVILTPRKPLRSDDSGRVSFSKQARRDFDVKANGVNRTTSRNRIPLQDRTFHRSPVQASIKQFDVALFCGTICEGDSIFIENTKIFRWQVPQFSRLVHHRSSLAETL